MGKMKPYILFILIGIISCSNPDIENIQHIIEEMRDEYAPDARTAIFDLKIVPGEPVEITGETNLANARQEFLNRLNEKKIRFKDDIIVLPDTSNFNQIHGIINVSVANLRSEPKHSAELVTQALLGSPVLILKEENGWLQVQTPDDYIAWTNSGSLVSMDESEFANWKQAEKLIYLQTYGFSMDASGEKVSDLVAGDVIVLEEKNEMEWLIRYPDDRLAMIRKSEAENLDHWVENIEVTETSITREAKEIMGVPYLWGGTSTKGVDCSGFTKTVYLNHGLILPRDASQQASVGELVDDQKDFSKLEIGDLLFFGRKLEDGSERVVHVGLWLGNNTFIHASGDVHISSMDSLSENFDEYNYNRYLRTKRIIGYESSLPSRIEDIY